MKDIMIHKILAFSAPILPVIGNAAASQTDTAWIGVLGQLGTIGILIYFLYIVWVAFQNLQKAQTKSIQELTAVVSKNSQVIEKNNQIIGGCRKVQIIEAQHNLEQLKREAAIERINNHDA